jgi:hypothetical protein
MNEKLCWKLNDTKSYKFQKYNFWIKDRQAIIFMKLINEMKSEIYV